MPEKREGFSLEAHPTMGATITELDLSEEVPANIAEALRQAWLEYPVLVFPELGDSSEKQLRLSRVFGEPVPHPNPDMRLKHAPELMALGERGETKGPPVVVDGEIRYGFLYYHQDTYYTPYIAKGAVLRMTKMPAKGGDTSFVDLEKAYAGLPDDLRHLCDQRHTIQVYREVPQPLWGMQDLNLRMATPEEAVHTVTPRPDWPLVVQPMVVEPPHTGKRTLLMSPAGYDGVYGMDKEEGDAFYERIAHHAMKPEYTYVHHWKMHDLIIWDNRRTMHWAMGYPASETRIVERTTLKGKMHTGKLLSEMEAA